MLVCYFKFDYLLGKNVEFGRFSRFGRKVQKMYVQLKKHVLTMLTMC